MRAGKLNRWIRIEQRATGPLSDYGTRPNTWTTFWEGWAEVEEYPPSRTERMSELIRNAERPALVRVRYLPGLTSTMRVVYRDADDRVMQILSQPVETGRRDGMEFFVSDHSTQGAAQ